MSRPYLVSTLLECKLATVFRYFPFVMTNGLRNRRRSVLTVASLAASLCLLAVLMAIYQVLFFSGESTPAER